MDPKFESSIPLNPAAPDSRRRIADAVDLAARELDPDQIVLFGSAARGEMTERSDIDLLVIREKGPFGLKRGFEGARVDVLVTDRATAEARRLLAADVRQYAFDDGRTLYVKDGFEPLPTGTPRGGNGDPMTRDPIYNFSRALEFLEKAEGKWRGVSRVPEDGDADTAEIACEALQRCMELSLKALHLSFGKPVKATHDLNELADGVERLAGGKKLFRMDPEVLKDLSSFAGRDFYDNPGEGGRSPVEIRKAAAEPAGAVLKYARDVVPGRIERLQKKFEQRKAAPAGTEPTEEAAPGGAGGRREADAKLCT